jgi:hypothetical protein
VTFAPVTGFSTPAAQTVEVGKWMGDEDVTEVEGVYMDTFDTRDDVAAGAAALSVSATANRAARTLFAEDPEDNFRFYANASSIYSFRLEQAGGADAVFMVTNAQQGVAVPATDAVGDLPLAAGTYYLVARHADAGAPLDTSYELVSVAYTPALVTPTVANGQAAGRLADGLCYFKANLKGGSKYMFGLSDASAKVEILAPEADGYVRIGDATFENGFAIYPETDAAYLFKVASEGASVTFRHKMAGTRAVAQHPVAGTLSVGVSSNAAPRYVNAPGSGFQDGIIDECLYKVQLAAGKSYLVSTAGAGAETNLLLRVYNAQGAVVAESRTDGVPGSCDVRALLEKPAAGFYYVGLARAGLDEIEYSGEPLPANVTLLVSEAVQEDGPEALEVRPSVCTNLVEAGFTSNRWTRTYTVAARKGVTYRLRADPADPAETNGLALAMRAYKRATPTSTVETKPVAAVWSGTPADDGAYELRANENATYYVELSVTNAAAGVGAKGCDYPAFTLSHEAVGTDGELGVLKVTTKGADGQWYLNAETGTKYGNGDSVLVAGTVKVTFAPVTGFSTPAAQTVEVGKWMGDEDVTEVEGVYMDTFDTRDDTAAGAAALTPTAAGASASRTLFGDDPEDNFRFTANAGAIYTFRLEQRDGRDALLMITNAQQGVVVSGYSSGLCSPDPVPVVSVEDLELSAGNYYLVVRHTNDADRADTTYTLVSVAYMPTVVVPGTYAGQAVGRPADELCYFKANLKGGSKYMFGLDGEAELEAFWTLNETGCTTADDGTFANGLAVYPDADDTYIFKVRSTSASVTFRHTMAKTRPVAQHPLAGALTVGESSNAVPGYVVEDPDYYDDIIDGCLYKVQLDANKKYLVETTASSVPLLMRVYNAQGAVVAENRYTNGEPGELNVHNVIEPSSELRALVETTAAGIYYVGLAADSDVEIPQGLSVDLIVEEVQEPQDDVTPLDFRPSDGWSELKQDGLGRDRWTRTYAISARKGVTYRFYDKYNTEETGFYCYSVKPRAYKLSYGRETALAAAVWSDEAVCVDNEWFYELRADENVTYYVELASAGGKSLYCAPYTLCYRAEATDGVTQLGVLTVNTKGADGQWYLGNETTAKYDGGASVLVPIGDGYKVTFTPVTGFSTPASQIVKVDAWTQEGDETVVEGVYSDTYDPRDNDPSAATMLSITATGGSASRTLFKNDPCDYFTFNAMAGYYYDFALEASDDSDAYLSIQDSTGKTVAEGSNGVSRVELGTGKFYAVVSHGGAVATDGSYKLSYKSANVGTIKFSMTSVSAREDVEYVDLTVNRSAREGAVRARFTTVAGTAKPGSEYYPTNGILEWAANDMVAKKVRVRLIPELVPTWEGSAKMFNVTLEAMAAEELSDGEYPASIATPTATVSLTETSVKAPGSIVVTGYSNGDDEGLSVGSAAAAKASVVAGQTLTLTLARAGGANGTVAVKPGVTAGTAKAGKDFVLLTTNDLIWADGEVGEKKIQVATVETADSGSWMAEKKFRLTLAAVAGTGYERPTLPTMAVETTIESDQILETLETYARGLSAADGLSVAGTAANVWFFDDIGALRTVPLSAGQTSTLTFTLTGPGFFKATPLLSDSSAGAYITCTVNGDDLGNVVGDEVAFVAPAGRHTVKFTVNAGSKAGSEGYEDLYASFDPVMVGDGLYAYSWAPLTGIAPDSPSDAATVHPTASTLSWSIPEAMEGEDGIYYRVSLAETASLLGTTNALFMEVTQDAAVNLGAGLLAPGMKYFWRVDCGYTTGYDMTAIDWVLTGKVWTFAVSGDSSSVPETSVLGGLDADGAELLPGQVATLVLGVQSEFQLGVTNVETEVTYAVTGGELPAGMSLDVATGVISGRPTKVGRYVATVQALSAVAAGVTIRLDFEVVPLRTAVGDYSGVVYENGSALTNGHEALGFATVTVGAGGKISAKVAVGGKTHTFAGDGFSEVVERIADGDPEFDYASLSATLIEKDGANTNLLTLTVYDAETNNLSQYGMAACRLAMSLSATDGDGLETTVEYAGGLLRKNVAAPAVVSALAPFAGYYTVALVPSGTTEGEAPGGSGYLTATVDATGGAKLAGVLADGTSFTASAQAGIGGTFDSSETYSDRTAIIPFAVVNKLYCFGGELTLRFVDDGAGGFMAVADSEIALVWNSDDAAATPSGDAGWCEAPVPVGGWYNTTYNLQRWYLGCDFSVETSDDLPYDLLGDGYAFSAQCTPGGMGLSLTGNKVVTPTKAMVRVGGATSAYDLAASVNPWGLTVNYTRATGLVSGSFSIWTETFDAAGAILRKEITGVQHKGVMLLSRDDRASLPEDVLTAGFYLVPTTTGGRRWNCSLPFNILARPIGDIDWYAEDGAEPPTE